MAMVLEEFVNILKWEVDKSSVNKANVQLNNLSNRLIAFGNKGKWLLTLPITGAFTMALRNANMFEQTSQAFATMLKDEEKAKTFLQDILNFTAKTPFNIQNSIGAAKQLLAVGFDYQKVIPILTALGNAAAGLGVPIERLIYNLGQIKAQGKLTARDMRDFMTAGVPVTEELAKMLGVSKEQVADMVSKGQITYDLVEKMFMQLSGKGGRFDNLMQRQSKTMGGMFSNLMDNITFTTMRFGRVFSDIIKKMLTNANKLLERLNYFSDSTLKWFGVLLLIVGISPLISLFLGKWIALGRGIVGVLTTINGLLTGQIALQQALQGATLGTLASYLIIPIVVALISAAIVLLINDLYNFEKGNDSVIGKIIEKWGKFGEAVKFVISKIERLIDLLSTPALWLFEKAMRLYYELENPEMAKFLREAKAMQTKPALTKEERGLAPGSFNVKTDRNVNNNVNLNIYTQNNETAKQDTKTAVDLLSKMLNGDDEVLKGLEK